MLDMIGIQAEVFLFFFKVFFFFNVFMIVTEREREAETQAEGEAGSMHQEPDVGFNPRSPGLHPGPKAGAKPLRHPGIPTNWILEDLMLDTFASVRTEKRIWILLNIFSVCRFCVFCVLFFFC